MQTQQTARDAERTHVRKRFGRYVSQSILGQGGMGVVYLARDERLSRLVAVKLCTSAVGIDDELFKRFDAESKLLGTLDHPNIVPVYDCGIHDRQPYFVMPYIEGQTLAELIAARAPLSLTEKVAYLGAVCDALDYAHAKGIVHRDIKPSNVMVDKDGRVRVVDFGVARLLESSHTLTGMNPGTPGYMAPEQIRGEAVDCQADVFALGAVAYELLTYRPAFERGGGYTALMRRVLEDAPAPLHLSDEAVGLERIVSRALAKAKEDRYATIADVRTDLTRASRMDDPQPSRPHMSAVPPRAAHRNDSVRRVVVPALIAVALVGGTVAFVGLRESPAQGMTGRVATTIPAPSVPVRASMVRVTPEPGEGVGHAFWMDVTEVTNADYQRFVRANPQWSQRRIKPELHDGDYLKLWTDDDFPAGKAQHPVVYVSYPAAAAYAAWSGKRLPTEAEWEYAAKSGQSTAYWWGDTFDNAHANRNGHDTEVVAKEERVSTFGLADMAGNVWEWTQAASDEGRERMAIVRGGSWQDTSDRLRSESRVPLEMRTTGPDLGFRCVSDSAPSDVSR